MFCSASGSAHCLHQLTATDSQCDADSMHSKSSLLKRGGWGCSREGYVAAQRQQIFCSVSTHCVPQLKAIYSDLSIAGSITGAMDLCIRLTCECEFACDKHISGTVGCSALQLHREAKEQEPDGSVSVTGSVMQHWLQQHKGELVWCYSAAAVHYLRQGGAMHSSA